MRCSIAIKYRRSLTSYRVLCILGLSILVSCAGAPPKAPPVKGGTVHQQKQLGPILGPVTKQKVLDRLQGYSVCGIQDEAQKIALKIRVIPLFKQETNGLNTIDPAKTQGVNRTSLIEMECFFFGFQGMYEFALITPQDGRLYPLSFQGSELVKPNLQINGVERKSPIGRNQGRSEVCGVPSFDPETLKLSSFCKADPSGGCGAYAKFTLVSEGQTSSSTPSLAEALQASSAYFKLDSAHFRSCAESEQTPPETWPEVSLPTR